jgi:predicted  nucleic acid-binding Zn-ribbon protein
VKTLKKREEKLRDDLASTLENFNQEKLSLENKVMELREEHMSSVQKLSEVHFYYSYSE